MHNESDFVKISAIPVANQFASSKRKEEVGYHHF
jgi:hypothetical protein